MVSITVYDGATTIGGNKIYVEEKEEGLFLDFGMNFAKYQEFFEEFLSERSARGIYDLIHLNIIPKLKIYRPDLIPRDLSINTYPELNVKAVLLSHAHLDHCGNIGLLKSEIPIIASPTTISILKALRDISPQHIGSEIAYYTPKKPNDDTGLVLKSGGDYIGRTFFCTGEHLEPLVTFLSEKPKKDAKKGKQLKPGQLCDLNELNLPFEIEAYEVDHSIFGANAYILRGDQTLAYTGDFRLHGRNASKTEEFINKAKAASILIIEGTRVERKDINETEEKVFQNCLTAVEESEKLVVADFSARNFERFETFKQIAKKTGRRLVVTAKDIYMLYGIECADGVCRIEDILIFNELRALRGNWETALVQDKWGSNYTNYDEISKNPEQYILCFSFFDLKHLLDVKPQGGTYIYSSSEAFSEEQAFDFRRLWKWLNFFKFKVYGFEMISNQGEPQPSFTQGYHASGHASIKELEQIINTIDPDHIISVHTTNPQWFKESFDKAAIPQEGQKIEF